MGSTFGNIFRATTFGESHGAALGVIVDGMPPGHELSREMIQRDLDRRRPGTSEFVSPRGETDQVELLSGVHKGLTLGTPIGMLIRNQDARSKDYGELAQVFRPGHADYTYFKKYGVTPLPGGGRASGRETAARVAAGAVARALLASRGVGVQAWVIKIGEISAGRADRDFSINNPLRCADPDAADAMAAQVRAARESGDSVGGMVEVVAKGVPAGWGDPVFDKLDASLGGAMLSIGGVKGVEVGDGFGVTGRRGSDNNDQMDENGFLSNHSGGILGGISTGQDIRLRLAVKPTPSISINQSTQDTQGGKRDITIHGRHDPCICPRVVPVAEAMTALVLADAMMSQAALQEGG